jgi:hypothetical protein
MNTEMVVLPAFCGMISFVIWAVVNAWQRRDRFRFVSEFNNRLLDRLGSTKDFSDFLQTDGGKKFMDALTVERGLTDARDRILRATQTGVVSLTLGLGFLFLGWRYSFANHDTFAVLGTIACSLGVGFLFSSGTTYWLARTLGVLDLEPGRASRQSLVR